MSDYINRTDPGFKKSTSDKSKLHLCNASKRWIDDATVGLTLQERDGKIYVKNIQTGSGLLFLSKASAFGYTELRTGDQILAINEHTEFDGLRDAELALRSNNTLSLIVFREEEPYRNPNSNRIYPGEKQQAPPHEDSQESFA